MLRRPISASDQILDRFYVISMEFLSLSAISNLNLFNWQMTHIIVM